MVALGAGGVGEETGEPFFGFAGAGDVDEAADDEADHFVEEAVAGEFEGEEVAVFAHFGAVDGAGGFFGALAALGFGHVAAIGGEADEVVGADEFFAAPAHGIEIERAIDVPGAVGFKGGEHARAPDAIAVGFADGVEAGVEEGRAFLDEEDADGEWEAGVEGVGPGLSAHADGFGHVAVGGLGEGVNAGVGAAAALHAGVDAGGFANGGVDFILNAATAFLALPAFPRRAVVGDGEAQALPARRRGMAQTGLTFDVASAHGSSRVRRRRRAAGSLRGRAAGSNIPGG